MPTEIQSSPTQSDDQHGHPVVQRVSKAVYNVFAYSALTFIVALPILFIGMLIGEALRWIAIIPGILVVASGAVAVGAALVLGVVTYVGVVLRVGARKWITRLGFATCGAAAVSLPFVLGFVVLAFLVYPRPIWEALESKALTWLVMWGCGCLFFGLFSGVKSD